MINFELRFSTEQGAQIRREVNMKITALVENTTNKDWRAEHGLSLFIETEHHKLLFDTGQSGLFAENAQKAGIDLSQVDICVLSHGHYDHGGGLKIFSQINDKAKIYMNRYAFGFHYHGSERYNGLERSWLEDDELQQRIVYTDGTVNLDEELTLCAPGRDKRVDMGSAGLCLLENGKFYPDDFRDEHYLLISENGKRVLFSGCSHQGIINIMEWFRPDVLIGGFHFMKQKPDAVLAEYGGMLDRYDTDYYTCHCTGTEQFYFLKTRMRRLYYLSEGEAIIV